jgi:hypothetical protein
LYRVTDVYIGDVVTVSGDTTVYTTTTAHQDTNTYARVLETVATGQPSRYDGLSFNARRRLSDGALIGGTYYQNYVFDGSSFVPVSIVFFQDDRELARHQNVPSGRPAPSPRAPGPLAPQPTASAGAPRTTPAPTLGPVPIGLDPSGGSGVLTRVEVARGARYTFRVNARGAALVAWSLASGVNDAVNAAGWHAADDPLIGEWLRLAPPGETWHLVLRVRVRWSGGIAERDDAIDVLVRSPAVVE